MKFLCFAYEEEGKFHDMSPGEWQALRLETLEYVAALREAGQLLAANPLQSARTAATVRVRDGEVLLTDGPFAETKEQIGGYFLLEAPTFEEAVRVASKWPSARIGSIEVRPVEEELRPERRYANPSGEPSGR
jgi:hypothetical protein